jgi:flagellar basal-body rod protein FlgG
MMRSLWISKTGLEAQQTNMDVISNNLANVSTNGFKRGRAVFEDLLYQTLRQPGAQSSQQTQLPTGLQLGTGVRPVATERIFTQGNLQLTSNPLDMAINGQGFFQLTLPDGQTAYTRDGNFSRDAQGQLVNQAGYVLSPGITIPLNAISITISEVGQVSVQLPGQVALNQIGELQITRFINPGGLSSIGGNMLVETAASGTPSPGLPGTDGAGTLKQMYTEASNVNVVEEMVNMIETQRAYEINSKSISAVDGMLKFLNQNM